jgi:ubiquinone/menaquinone biosynthesis C-methylase UbiE
MSDATESENLVRYEGDRVAGWVKWFHITDISAQPVSDRMVALAVVEPGSRVLDIATGLGEPALTAARAALPGGHVLATDLSEEMMAFAATRAGKLGLTNVTFRMMDANEPDLDEAAFDAVLSRWGLMFLARLDNTLACIRRCLKPGGRFVAVVWGPPAGAPTNSLADRVIRRKLGLPPPSEGPFTPFALQDTDSLMARTRKAGFGDVSGEWIDVMIEFRSTDEFAEYRRDRASSIKPVLAKLSPEEQDAAWQAVADAAEAFKEADGKVRMSNRAFCMVAVVS